MSAVILFLSQHLLSVILAWVAVTLLGVSFVAGGTSSSAEQDKWGQRSFFLALAVAVAAVFLF